MVRVAGVLNQESLFPRDTRSRIADYSAGMDTNGRFKFVVSGVEGVNYTVQTSTNLKDWLTLLTTNSPSRAFEFNDPGSTDYTARFYRAQLSP